MHACGEISAHADPRGQAWELKPCYPGALPLSRPQRRSNTPSATASHPAPEPFRPIIEDDTPREIRGGRPQRLSSTPVKERPWSHKEAARRQKQRKKDAPSLLHPAPARHPWAHQRLVLEGHCQAAGATTGSSSAGPGTKSRETAWFVRGEGGVQRRQHSANTAANFSGDCFIGTVKS